MPSGLLRGVYRDLSVHSLLAASAGEGEQDYVDRFEEGYDAGADVHAHGTADVAWNRNVLIPVHPNLRHWSLDGVSWYMVIFLCSFKLSFIIQILH